jgi:hypothetical protein
MDKCEMCGATIHSITTRRAGDHQFCRDCGDDIVLPLVNNAINVLVDSMIFNYKNNGGKHAAMAFGEHLVLQMTKEVA